MCSSGLKKSFRRYRLRDPTSHCFCSELSEQEKMLLHRIPGRVALNKIRNDDEPVGLRPERIAGRKGELASRDRKRDGVLLGIRLLHAFYFIDEGAVVPRDEDAVPLFQLLDVVEGLERRVPDD